jgi:hypothetical protein
MPWLKQTPHFEFIGEQKNSCQKHLPKDKFEDALKWLNERLQSLMGDTPF